jgi:spermidine synthase
VAVAVLAIAGPACWSRAAKHSFAIERFHGNSHFGQIQVLDHPSGTFRLFSNDLLIQNTYDPARKQSASQFTYMLSGLARAYTTNIQAALCIGLGVGIVPMELARQGARVDVVEINPAVPPVAARFFDADPSQLHIVIDDARHFLNRCNQQYDVVVLDAFLGDSSPSHLMTREAFTAMRRVLRPGGVLVINVFCRADDEDDFFGTSLHKTLSSVFAGIRVHAGAGQSYFVATDRADPQFVRPPQIDQVYPQIRFEVQSAFGSVVSPQPGKGRVLTDNFNPVEFYDAKHRETMRRQFALGSRQW